MKMEKEPTFTKWLPTCALPIQRSDGDALQNSISLQDKDASHRSMSTQADGGHRPFICATSWFHMCARTSAAANISNLHEEKGMVVGISDLRQNKRRRPCLPTFHICTGRVVATREGKQKRESKEERESEKEKMATDVSSLSREGDSNEGKKEKKRTRGTWCGCWHSRSMQGRRRLPVSQICANKVMATTKGENEKVHEEKVVADIPKMHEEEGMVVGVQDVRKKKGGCSCFKSTSREGLEPGHEQRKESMRRRRGWLSKLQVCGGKVTAARETKESEHKEVVILGAPNMHVEGGYDDKSKEEERTLGGSTSKDATIREGEKERAHENEGVAVATTKEDEKEREYDHEGVAVDILDMSRKGGDNQRSRPTQRGWLQRGKKRKRENATRKGCLPKFQMCTGRVATKKDGEKKREHEESGEAAIISDMCDEVRYDGERREEKRTRRRGGCRCLRFVHVRGCLPTFQICTERKAAKGGENEREQEEEVLIAKEEEKEREQEEEVLIAKEEENETKFKEKEVVAKGEGGKKREHDKEGVVQNGEGNEERAYKKEGVATMGKEEKKKEYEKEGVAAIGEGEKKRERKEEKVLVSGEGDEGEHKEKKVVAIVEGEKKREHEEEKVGVVEVLNVCDEGGYDNGSRGQKIQGEMDGGCRCCEFARGRWCLPSFQICRRRVATKKKGEKEREDEKETKVAMVEGEKKREHENEGMAATKEEEKEKEHKTEIVVIMEKGEMEREHEKVGVVVDVPNLHGEEGDCRSSEFVSKGWWLHWGKKRRRENVRKKGWFATFQICRGRVVAVEEGETMEKEQKEERVVAGDLAPLKEGGCKEATSEGTRGKRGGCWQFTFSWGGLWLPAFHICTRRVDAMEEGKKEREQKNEVGSMADEEKKREQKGESVVVDVADLCGDGDGFGCFKSPWGGWLRRRKERRRERERDQRRERAKEDR